MQTILFPFVKQAVSIARKLTDAAVMQNSHPAGNGVAGWKHAVLHFLRLHMEATLVEVPGGLSATYHRTVRFNRLTHVHEGMTGDLVVALGVTAAAVAVPLVIAPVVTLVTGIVYALLGLRRPTFLLSFPGLFFVPLTILAGMFIPEFEWAGRRYRLNGEYDIEVID